MKVTKIKWLGIESIEAEKIELEGNEVLEIYYEILDPKTAPVITSARKGKNIEVVYSQNRDIISHITIGEELLFNVKFRVKKEGEDSE